MIDRKDRIYGGIYGLLVGDALGVPYEFHKPTELPDKDKLEFSPPKDFERSHSTVLPGTWSDDGAQALCLLDTLVTNGKFDLYDFADNLLRWYQDGFYAIDNDVFDVGIQTSKALSAYYSGMSPKNSGNIVPDGKGNGALMRALPLAIWHKGNDEELVRDAHLQSLVTHGHICNQICSALYCLWARRILDGVDQRKAYNDATFKLRKIYSEETTYKEYISELEFVVRPDDVPEGSGSGYVVDSLKSARMVMAQNNYEDVVKEAVALGNDTDTTAVIAGGIAGVIYGYKNIPHRWIEGLRGKELVEPLLKKLIN